MARECDVLVVGNGPAGSSASFFLKFLDKENKFKVILLERLNQNKYPVYHSMCGEGVSEDLFKDISPIKLGFVIEKIRKQRQFWPEGIVIETPMDGYILDRTNFFKSINEQFIKQGGEYIENSLVNLQVKEKIKIKLANGDFIETKYLIAADGANSFIRRKFQIDGRTKPLMQYITDEEPEHNTTIFEFDEKWGGDYKWIFPHGDKTKIGSPYVKDIGKVEGAILAKQTRMIGFGGIKDYVLGNILFVGDAACQTNPITKGGIRSGMVAGKMAAEAIIHDDPGEYDKMWKNSDYGSPLFLNAFDKLKNMDNKELAKHVRPFLGGMDISTVLKLALFYRKYSDMYNAYKLSDNVGW